jgi:GntR family transcriptional regulator, carbon starvation induced regulator
MGAVQEKESSLVLQGYDAVRTLIVRGEFAPGKRLRLDALQQALNLSSSPLREALNRLVAEGLVEVEEGKGFRVAQISVEDFRELTYVRILLEGDALRRAIQLGDDEWEGRVVSAYHRLRRIEERESETDLTDLAHTNEWSTRHRTFHIALLSGCGYPRLTQMCATLFDQAERYRRLALHLSAPRRKSLEHKRLQEAVLARDAEKAVDLLAAHIQKTADRVANLLQGSQEGATATAAT